jgi:putative tricarboxylic transport membrane protein
MLLGLTAIAGLTGGSKMKGFAMGFIGIAISCVGLDLMTTQPRFTFGSLELMEGINFLPIAVGMFGIAEVFVMLEQSSENFQIIKTTLRDMLITRDDMRRSAGPIIRGTIIGFFVGVLPGAGATIASFFSYAFEKKISKYPERFGTGMIEGVASPESANNSSTGGAMVPLLTLGIPGSGTTAVMLGALTLFSLQPGPLLFTKNPDFVWGLIASMYIGNVMLLVLNILFVPAFVAVLRVRYEILAPLIMVFCVVGVYSLDYSMMDLWVMFGFGVIGYLMKKLDYPAAPLVLALVLGGQMETNLRRSLKMSLGDISIFFNRPISGVIMIAAILIIIWPLINRFVVKPILGREIGEIPKGEII